MRLANLALSAAFLTPAMSSGEALRVLTYDSMVGKHSLGDFLKEEFPKESSGCGLDFTTTNEMSGLLGKLRSDKRRGLAVDYDLVMGLDFDHYQAALKEGLVEPGQVFDHGAFALIVDTQRFPAKEWPRSWSGLEEKLSGKILIEDPRLSSVGQGWLKAIYQKKLLDPKTAKALVSRVFPSWSSAYAAFLEGQGLAVWSFWTSVAYHRCNEKKEADRQRYQALPLAEGYPESEEWAAVVKISKEDSAAPPKVISGTPSKSLPVAMPINGAGVKLSMEKNFLKFLASARVQSVIPLKNWMYPSLKTGELPGCFVKPTVPVLPNSVPIKLDDLQRWTDEWSL